MQPLTPADSAVAPVVLRYVPAGQEAGVTVPATQYLPAGQGRHADAAALFANELYVPATQRISSPSGQYLPALQLKQLPRAVASAGLYFPGGHLMAAGDASGQYEPAGHAVQADAVAPKAPKNVPAAPRVGVDIPSLGHMVPGGHFKQAAWDVAVVDPE